MLVHGRERRETELLADLLEAGRVAVLLNELVEVVQNLALPFGKREHMSFSNRAKVCAKERRKSTSLCEAPLVRLL